MKIFLDDERFPPNNKTNWKICRNFDEFKSTIKAHGMPEFISFDHDLGEEKTGYDCVKWLCHHILMNYQYVYFEWYVHSQNPVGKKNIEHYLNHFFNYMKKENAHQVNVL